MEYIIQIFTGGWNNQNYTAGQIKDRIAFISTMIPVKSVIIGWNINADLYREVNIFLHENRITSFLWLPVFSETGELQNADPAVDIHGGSIGSLALQEGENFTFFCPSSEKDIRNVYRIYEENFSDCGFDGVFLDKIRTQSFVGGLNGVLSCGCPSCEQLYRKAGLPLREVQKLYVEKGDEILETTGYQKGSGFVMKYQPAEDFLRIKGEIIAGSVTRICRYFRHKGMQTGLDLYAPLLSRFTGQNYELISREADFIKPMLYRKTEAPAGIGYEYRLLKQSLPHCRNYPEIHTDTDFLRAQLEEFQNLPCLRYPGIEINYREDIARTDEEYVRESLKAVKECGMNGAVLAWDVMLAPDSHIEVLKEL